MFASNALPPPATFGHEHRPLRLTSESSRPQPQGGCHFQHSPGPSQRCLCQTYQHNRSLQGNVCDCGHSACYHTQTNIERRLSPDRVINALLEKVKKLEDIVIKERELRNSEISRERQAWEREVRVLREALAPFYQSESEMKRRLMQLEDRLDSSYDEQSRLKERVVAIDDASMTLERRVEDVELYKKRKRKASLIHETNSVMSPESSYTYTSSSAASDATSVSTQRSPQPPSPMNLPVPVSTSVASPRSSGVLHLKSGPRYGHAYQPHKVQLPSPVDEPRSSGFLSIDLAERLRKHKLSPSSNAEVLPSISATTNGMYIQRAPTMAHGLPSPPPGKAPDGALTVSGLLSPAIRPEHENRSAKRYKQDVNGIMALEILANATVEQTVAH